MNGIEDASRPNAAPFHKPIRFVSNLDGSPYAKRRRISSACLVKLLESITSACSNAFLAMPEEKDKMFGRKAGLQYLLTAET
jgi:hypothetical protein